MANRHELHRMRRGAITDLRHVRRAVTPERLAQIRALPKGAALPRDQHDVDNDLRAAILLDRRIRKHEASFGVRVLFNYPLRAARGAYLAAVSPTPGVGGRDFWMLNCQQALAEART